MHIQASIDQSLYKEFLAKWNAGGYPHLRFGQAFYNHFNLHKMTQSNELDKIWAVESEEEGKVAIRSVFNIN